MRDRKYIEMSGKDTVKLLQGIMSNDASKLEAAGSVLACAFLTPKGRVFADTICYNLEAGTATDGPRLVLEVHTQVYEAMTRHLTMHKLRSAVALKHADLCCLVVPPSSPAILSTAKDTTEGFISSYADPRGADFGTRLLARPGSSLDNLFASTTEATPAEYERFRLLRGLPDTPELIGRIPLECNLDLLQYISFRKGCYVGQELTSRTKFRGLVRKRLQPYILLDASTTTVPQGVSNEGVEDGGETRVSESVYFSPQLGMGLAFIPVEQQPTFVEETDQVAAAGQAALSVGATALWQTEVRIDGQMNRVLTFKPPIFRNLAGPA